MPSVKLNLPHGADDCGHTPNLDLSDEVKEERRRCLVTLLPLLKVLESAAPQPVQMLAGMTLDHILDLCPAHSTEEDTTRALAAIGIEEGNMEVIATRGLALSLNPLSPTRGSA